MLLTGAVEDHHLSEILELDPGQWHEEKTAVPHAISRISDAMPGFGIVAAVLGVIITMGSINGAASEIGEKVAAALVGTFLGILFAYGVFSPIATAVEARIGMSLRSGADLLQIPQHLLPGRVVGGEA